MEGSAGERGRGGIFWRINWSKIWKKSKMWCRSRSRVGWLVGVYFYIQKRNSSSAFSAKHTKCFQTYFTYLYYSNFLHLMFKHPEIFFYEDNLTLPSDQNWKEEDNSSLYKTGDTCHSEIVGKVWNNYSPREREGVFYREVLCASFFWHESIKLLNSKLLKFLSTFPRGVLMHFYTAFIKRSVPS